MRKILTIIGGENAVGYFRFLMPVNYINNNMDVHIETAVLNKIDYSNKDLYKYDVIHFHANALQYEPFRSSIIKLKAANVKLIMDCDDYWVLPKTSPYYGIHSVDKYIHKYLPIVDAVTTTTRLFRDVLSDFNKNVYILPNCIDKSLKQYENKPTEHSRLRIGLVGGASHLNDLKLLDGIAKLLKKELVNDIQLVLCGFDTKGLSRPEFSIWNEFEQLMTDDYRILDREYMMHLCRYNTTEYPNEANMPYRRIWSKGIYEYASVYNDIDVLIAPIENNKFNCMKSELKGIEAGTMGKALIASNVGINKLVYTNGKDAILIDNCRGAKQWAKAIKYLLNDKDALERLKIGLKATIDANYDIDVICKNRLNLYLNI